METPELYHIIIEYIVIIIEIIVGILVSAIVIISIANLVRLLLSKLIKDRLQVYVRNIVARDVKGPSYRTRFLDRR